MTKQPNRSLQKHEKRNPFSVRVHHVPVKPPKLSSSWAKEMTDSMLATMQVRVIASNQQFSMPIRALCDSGSQVNLITSDCVQHNSLTSKPINMHIIAVGDVATMKVNGYVDLEIASRHSTPQTTFVRALIVNKITSKLPVSLQPRYFRDTLQDQELADPLFYLPAKIDILLGVGFWTQVVMGEIKREQVSSSFVLAQRTTLGWTITTCQRDGSETANKSQSLHFITSTAPDHRLLEELNDNIRRFWEIDNIQEKTVKSADDKCAELIFTQTHQRNASGRYVVRIPFRPDGPILGNSRRTALRQFLKLEERYASRPELEKFVRSFFLDYIESGHMSLAPAYDGPEHAVYYTPYHVITGRKPRTVFNSSCKTDTGVSLNDLQLSGPRLQEDLPLIFMRFRFNEYAIVADITQMFRQIVIHPDDRDFQRIFWRPDANGPIREYKIEVVMWGQKSAPFNAIKSMQQLAIDEADKYPIAAEATSKDFYVDDFLSGKSSESKLRVLYQQMVALFLSGGFKLAKWATNCAALTKEFNAHRESDVSIISDAGVLGMVWKVQEDNIGLKIRSTENDGHSVVTKADVVSAISKVYDPTGLFAPVMLIGKIIMQDFWKEANVKWKDPAPEHLLHRWRVYHAALPQLANIKISRWLNTKEDGQIECHIFADASMKAYGAVAYIRAINVGQPISVRLLTSKSRVAPIKLQTIPRLELLAACTATELAGSIRSALPSRNLAFYYWSDSMIVLCWIRKEVNKLAPFVGARISRILETSCPESWHYVNTNDNPADVLSRSIPATELAACGLWWSGPHWLSQLQSNWPLQPELMVSAEDELHITKETRKTPVVTLKTMIVTPEVVLPGSLPRGLPEENYLNVCSHNNFCVSLLSRRSTLNGLLRVTSYVMRFIRMLKQVKMKEISRPLSIAKPLPKLPIATIKEREEALMAWVQIVQRVSFKREINSLKDNEPIPRTSPLLRMTPFWNAADKTLRIRGRIKNSERSFSENHPCVLPYQHDFVQLLIQDAHAKTLHGGPQLCIAILRQQFWILKVRVAVRRYISSKCVSCIRHSKMTAQQLMGALPVVRTTLAPPFSSVGVDFAGPFKLRKFPATVAALRRAVSQVPKEPTTIKGWVVVFVCLTTRAVHLDVTRGLNVEAFLECFGRLTARRGPCKELFSDNGTTFTGANNELSRVLREWENSFPEQALSEMGTTWRFITPGAPFKGGIWEAAVKTFKHHLKRVLGDRIITIDQMYTLVVQIEACMNARPLFAQSDDPMDTNPITPAHLVIGRSTLQRPLTENLMQTEENRLTLWGLQQRLYQQFWHSWRHDYIAAMQLRNKWYKIQYNLKESDMVLLQDENSPPSKWPVGRIVSVQKSADQLVRSAEVRIPVMKKDKDGKMKVDTTILNRPIQKLCILLPDDVSPTPMPIGIQDGMPD